MEGALAVNGGRMLVIANPAAQNGAGQAAALQVKARLEAAVGAEAFDLAMTRAPQHAAELAQQAAGYETVVALGGDGAIHEVANGLMRIAAQARPTLGVVPVGSGNDFAYTLGVPETVDQAVDVLLRRAQRTVDVGLCNGEHFVQTLSFGLDAAIAIDTMERRKRTGRKGTMLYLESGIDQLFHHLDEMPYEVRFVGAQPLAYAKGGKRATAQGAVPARRNSAFLFAVQNGPTYGGHFKVCPDASPADGFFDVCIAHPPLNVANATGIFLLAKGGHHTGFKQIEMLRCRGLDVVFDRQPAAQMDGEALHGTRFRVSMVPQALRVIGA